MVRFCRTTTTTEGSSALLDPTITQPHLLQLGGLAQTAAGAGPLEIKHMASLHRSPIKVGLALAVSLTGRNGRKKRRYELRSRPYRVRLRIRRAITAARRNHATTMRKTMRASALLVLGGLQAHGGSHPHGRGLRKQKPWLKRIRKPRAAPTRRARTWSYESIHIIA